MHKTDLYLFGGIVGVGKANWVIDCSTVAWFGSDSRTDVFKRFRTWRWGRVVWWRFGVDSTAPLRARTGDVTSISWARSEFRLFFDSWWSFKRRHVWFLPTFDELVQFWFSFNCFGSFWDRFFVAVFFVVASWGNKNFSIENWIWFLDSLLRPWHDVRNFGLAFRNFVFRFKIWFPVFSTLVNLLLLAIFFSSTLPCPTCCPE